MYLKLSAEIWKLLYSWINSFEMLHSRLLRDIADKMLLKFQRIQTWPVRKFSARRALLYVPGDDMKKLQKAVNLQVDTVLMDCEDGVAINRKDAARATIKNLLDSGTLKTSEHAETHPSEWAVRVNSVDSGLCGDDLAVLLQGANIPLTIAFPKVESTDHIQWFADSVKKHIKDHKPEIKINLIIYIESPRSVMNMSAICKRAEELSATTPCRPVALVFGSDDLCASLGATRSDDAMEMLYARQKLVLVAKAFNLQAIDMVQIQYKDLEGLKKQCIMGARMGYTGKQVIHPGQVPVVQEAFLPTPEVVTWAEGLVTAFNEHQEKGKGAFVYKGSMIDMPSLRQAQNILKLSKLAKGKHS